jgi:hypothetical protein
MAEDLQKKLAWVLSILPSTWTPIATRPRVWVKLDEPAPWTRTDDAVLSVDEADALMCHGVLLRALKYSAHEIAILVKPRRELPPPPAPPPSSAAGPITEWPPDRIAQLHVTWCRCGSRRP